MGRCRHYLLMLTSALAFAAHAGMPESTSEPVLPRADVQTMRTWIAEMKEDRRGPFENIRWYCQDGSVLEPEPYACEPHGGGIQHGAWSDRTQAIRAAGFPIANVLAALEPIEVVGHGAEPDLLPFLLLEKFLIAFDDGWILRKARAYRGALQIDDERLSATRMLRMLLGDPVWRERFLVLREASRLLPVAVSAERLTEIRGLSTTLAEQDAGFAPLRDKTHNAPDAQDAERIRAYAAAQGLAAANPAYAQLADMIEQAYADRPLAAALLDLSQRVRDHKLANQLVRFSEALDHVENAQDQLRWSAEILQFLRIHLLKLGSPTVRLDALKVSLIAGTQAFTSSRMLFGNVDTASRGMRLTWMHWSARALFGMGLLTRAELDQMETVLLGLQQAPPSPGQYQADLQYLERATGWASRRLTYHFGAAITGLRPLEPLVDFYIPDRLRASPMLFYSDLLESLLEDAARIGGVQHRFLGESISAGLRPLNPGLAEGVLNTTPQHGAAPATSATAIWLLPETTANLPPVAGILTAGEGNALSHIQLLARSLGIPNVVVAQSLIPRLQELHGHHIVLAASSMGIVQVERYGPEWAGVFREQVVEAQPQTIQVNIEKLDLSNRAFLSTRDLGADDSGRTVGPKAAHVGELTRRFPGKVSPGLVIPFGIYSALLERPRIRGSPQSMFSWMQASYLEMARLEPLARIEREQSFLSEVRDWILSQPLEPRFAQALREAMEANFGPDGSYGVFVRSDTNVEDLPGFTGAGLNRTVHHVVGVAAVLDAIREVWASPFSERAFRWRQGHMDFPEHVYASVLLHESVPAEKSGVMITADPDTADTRFLTIVTSPGVGGGVDGQAAETLRVNLETGAVRLLASATAAQMRVLRNTGGSVLVEAPAPDRLLLPEELQQLVDLAQALPTSYPPLLDAQGNRAPADIEFGFQDGQLKLFQIRPFVQNARTSRNRYLGTLDAALRERQARAIHTVDLQALPGKPTDRLHSVPTTPMTGTPSLMPGPEVTP